MFPRIIAFVTLTELSGVLWCAAAPQAPTGVGPETNTPLAAAGHARLVTNYANEASVTGGIQEAIDSLPQGGGTVYVPEGVYEIHSPIRMRPGTVLTGAGRNSILHKAPAWFAPLAEDAKAGSEQGYVVVRDTSGLRPGMGALVGDSATHDADVLIDRIEGNKVYLKAWNIYDLRVTPWRPSKDALVSRKAALANGHCIIRTSDACVISHLALDGNRNAQTVDGEPLYKTYGIWWNRLRCAPYMGGYSRMEHCWVYGAAGVALSLGWVATVSNCDISASYQGLHPGAGPNSKIIGNRIHHIDDQGIMLCEGNYGLVISQNHIHDNGAGIGGLGIPEHKIVRAGDLFCIISQNVIFRNRGNAITTGHATLGAQDFVITDNIILNNCTAQGRLVRPARYHSSPAPKLVPAGICLYNARRCIIANNRVMDDQDAYPLPLSADAPAGSTQLRTDLYVHTMFYEQWAGFYVTVSDGERSERCLVKQFRADGRDRVLELEAPLTFDYAKGAQIIPEKTQLWGIVAAGPRSETNVIANNLCVGNGVGGILWDGKEMVVNANAGLTAAMDASKSLEENVYPAAERVALANAGFEGRGGWQLGPGMTIGPNGHTGERSLRIARTEVQEGAAAVSAPIELQPNTRYRIAARVRTEARRGDRLALPVLSLHAVGGPPVIEATQPAIRSDFEPVAADPARWIQWIQVTGEGITGPERVQGVIRCGLGEGVVGPAWVDDIAVGRLGG